MLLKYPIFIPSKNRAQYKYTTKVLDESNVSYFVVIEPQDYEEYSKEYSQSKLIVMPENNQGIAYARSFCKKTSIHMGSKYHYQIDDNIRNFAKRENNKNIKCSALDCLLPLEKYVNDYVNIGLTGLSHIMFAFAKKNELDLNKQIYSCFLVNNSIDLYWKKDTIEDTDYSLNILSRNYCTVLFNRLLMNKLATMTIKGGNTDSEHAGDGRMKRSLQLQSDWPQAKFQITNQYNRVKIKHSRIWQTFKQMPLKEKETNLDKWM